MGLVLLERLRNQVETVCEIRVVSRLRKRESYVCELMPRRAMDRAQRPDVLIDQLSVWRVPASSNRHAPVPAHLFGGEAEFSSPCVSYPLSRHFPAFPIKAALFIPFKLILETGGFWWRMAASALPPPFLVVEIHK